MVKQSPEKFFEYTAEVFLHDFESFKICDKQYALNRTAPVLRLQGVINSWKKRLAFSLTVQSPLREGYTLDGRVLESAEY